METRANFVLIGAFTLAVIAGAFLFVMWFAGLAKLAPHQSYRIVFSGSVSGLSTGGNVLFNGLKVGEVVKIDFDDTDPAKVVATIDVDARAPIKKDTRARLEVQGLTGAAAVALTGGSRDSPPLVGENGGLPTIVADPSQLQSLLESVQTLSSRADTVFAKADKILSDNGPAIDTTLANIAVFSKALGDSSSGINTALTSLSDLGAKIGPLSTHLGTLTDDLDNLVKAVDTNKVRSTVDNIQSFSGALADSKGSIQSTLADAATLAKRLNDTSQRLDSALDDIDALAKSIDADKVRTTLDNIESFSGALAQSKDAYQSLVGDLGGIVKSIDKQKVGQTVDHIEAFTGTLADNKTSLDSLFKNADTLTKRLVDTSQKLDTALGDVDTLVKAVDASKVAGTVNSVQEFAATLSANKGNVDRTLKDVAELSAKLNESADKIDGLMTSLQGFVGSPETKGALSQIGDAAQSVRRLADDLDVRTKDIAVGLSRFSNSGLREFEALAIDARRAVNDIDRTVRSLEKNPSQIIFGSKPALPEYRGGP